MEIRYNTQLASVLLVPRQCCRHVVCFGLVLVIQHKCQTWSVVLLCPDVRLMLCWDLAGFPGYCSLIPSTRRVVGALGKGDNSRTFYRMLSISSREAPWRVRAHRRWFGSMLFKQALVILTTYKPGIRDCGMKTLESVLGKLINCKAVASSWFFLNLKVTLSSLVNCCLGLLF